MNYGFVIDNSSCIGCHACSTACKSENEVPLGVYRTWVKYTEVGQYPDTRRSFQVTRCNHCSNPPCVRICPTGAMHQRADGIVDFDTDACIGCKACTQACPYDAIHIDPSSHTAAKCNYCVHRVDVGLEPACVVVCPEHAIIAGDLDDPNSEISRMVAKHDVTVRKPEQGTAPKLFYIDGHDPAMHPTARNRDKGFQWADVMDDHHVIGHVGNHDPSARVTRNDPRGTSVRVPADQGHPPGGPIHFASDRVASTIRVGYNAQHKVQWHWQIPAYIVTKHIAAGVFGLLALTALAPGLPFSPAAMVTGGLVGLLMTLVTLVLLIIDLDRPDRFFYLLIRPQWRSWVARAAWILASFNAITTIWWLLEVGAWLGWLPEGAVSMARIPLAVLTIPTSILAATYTAFLFAQAEGRDLWQAPQLPMLMAAQGVMFGAGTLLALDVFLLLPPTVAFLCKALFVGGAAISVVTTLVGDLAIAPPSEIARRTLDDLVRGSFRNAYWGGIALAYVVPLLLAALGVSFADAAALVVASFGLFLWAWAFVMAPQAVQNS
ncbi:MAG: polysulfide reductase NrfD [Alphaproteobacteria bacterium]|nr:polysulfide reductase NrfD [Alphaproteobacteria bacterium]MCB9697925.1 polysulfide reductase NrfD [Alphaproteobacteria bacterium]